MGRALVVAVFVAIGVGGTAAQTSPEGDGAALLSRASAWVETLEQQFAVVIADEAYHQQIGTERYPVAPKENFRDLQSEVVFLWVPDENMWVTARNVRSVDKEPVEGSSTRLQRVLSEAGERVQRVRGLRSESTKFNLGSVYRNFNDPTFALQYLDGRWRDRFRWTPRGRDRIRNADTWRLDFSEIDPPYLVQALTTADTLPSTGSVWIERTSGIVYQTHLEIWDPKERMRASLKVELDRDAKLGFIVPVRMLEEYTVYWPQRLDVKTVIFGTAEYRNFRRFETSGRLIDRTP